MNGARMRGVISKEVRVFQLYKIKFSNGETVRKRLFGEIQSYNDKLEKLLDTSDKDAFLVQQRNVVAQTNAIDTAICSFWLQARKLFKALVSAWGCQCKAKHTTKLLLQHQTTKQPEFYLTFTTFQSPYWSICHTRVTEGNEAVAAAMTETINILERVAIHQPGHRVSNPAKSAMKSSNTTCIQLLK
jgi:hypothetical protein